ncbi:MAG: gluconate 2-dehydrogenase subunit 3 family protein [Acidobacteriota bacterium]|nr:gluconate 2-dehydrogenase subunit 3 family protein [Acidobacteriota bacterium]
MRKPARSTSVTRRHVLTAGTAAAGAVTLFPGPAVAQAAADGVDWTPRILSGEQAALLDRLCDLILPRTATPGALDAGVPAYIDLAVSLGDPEEQLEFLGGLGWIERRASQVHGGEFLSLSHGQQEALLNEIADELEPGDPLAAGAAFFADLKGRTLFGFFTSKEGRVEVLGRPGKVERQKWKGCSHSPGHHKA